MQTKLLTHNTQLTGYECEVCNKRLRAGQVVIYKKLGPRFSTLIPYFAFHKHCIQRLLQDAPPDEDEAAFQRLKKRIHDTGKAFPDG